MFVDHRREKLINAMIYFIKNTKHCHTLKLFKLLYFLDFEHFRQTGQSVTGLTYKAWPNGPAPAELWQELKNPAPDLAKAVQTVPVTNNVTDKLLRRDLLPRKPFSNSFFSKRELKIMETLAYIFDDAPGDDMTNVSHARRLPWGMVYEGGKGRSQPIPYELALICDNILRDEPALSNEEYEYRKSLFKEIDAHH